MMTISSYILLLVATFPFIYYLIALYSAIRYFRNHGALVPNVDFTPPVSNIKPIRGIDPDAYENFASLCRQNYPEYELLFCVSSSDDPVVEVLDQLIRDFPNREIRIIYGSGRSGTNDKVCKLARLASEAKYETLVINDSDVWVDPDYLRTIVAPLRDPKIGAVTCFYFPRAEKTFADDLQAVGMISDFFAGVIVAWQLDGIKFALGTTIATRRANLTEFGGYECLENRPADDLLVGRLIAEQGHEVKLLPYSVSTVSDYSSFSELLHKRLRWIVVMRYMRPSGHFGLLFTFGLFWCIVATAVHPSVPVAIAFFGVYLILRVLMTWLIGTWGLKQRPNWTKLPLIVLWDAVAFSLWLFSFTRKSVRWRGSDYYIRDGRLVPVATSVPEPATLAKSPE
jgi:ceramide glucosyltransferase